MIAVALVAFAFAMFQVVMHQRALSEVRATYEASQLQDRALISELIMQVQVNAQGLPHYPQVGPFEPVPEKHILRDDTGLIEYEVDPDDERDFADAASL